MTDSRAKGARGEREFAAMLKTRFPQLDFARGIQTRGGGAEAADVYGLPGFHFEVKRVEALNVWKALAQAQHDADPQSYAAVAFRRNRSGWYVAQPAEDWFDLAEHSIPYLG